MRELTLSAPAKLNLTLDILRRREDGYHDLKMVMTSVSLYDTVTVRLNNTGTITVSSGAADLPAGEDNLAGKAARAFFNAVGAARGADITIKKQIPSCAGMAGGSSDAAAVLRALGQMLRPDLPGTFLEELGQKVGSDVPYCVRGGTALAEGRGERLTDWPALPDCRIAICKPDFGLPTPALFGRVRVEKIENRPDHAAMYGALAKGDLRAVAANLRDVFEEVLEPGESEIFTIRDALLQYGALGAAMTGSGPAVFGLFDDTEAAERAYERLRDRYVQTFLTQPV